MRRALAAAGAALLLAALPSAAGAGARGALDSMMINRAREAGGLDEQQAQKLRSAVALYRANVERLRDAFRGHMKTLESQIKAGAPDAEVSKTLALIESTYRSIMAERHKLVEDAAGYLSPSQRAKIALDLAGRGLKRAP